MKLGLSLLGLLSVTALVEGQAPAPQTPSTPKAIAIVGAVSRPGMYALGEGRTTLLRILAISGMFTPNANKNAVQILRVRQAALPGTPNATETIEVDVDAILTGKMADIELQPGDVVSVPARSRPQTPAPLPFLDLPDPIRKVASRF